MTSDRLHGAIPSIACVGTFDGVHRGHRLVLQTLLDKARLGGLRPLAFTFDRHPLEIIAPDRVPPRIESPAIRNLDIEAMGATVVEMPLTESLLSMTTSQWLSQLKDHYGVRAFVVGYDNKFGSDSRDWPAERFVEEGAKLGMEVWVAPRLPDASSTRIRRLVGEGRLSEAAILLGRPFTLHASVVHGRHVGRTIGFPTANLDIVPGQLLPSPGVYAAIARTDDGERFPAMVNIGMRPTLDDNRPLTVEAHLIDTDRNLYGQNLAVAFLSRLRDERRFDSLEALRDQLVLDRGQARSIARSEMCSQGSQSNLFSSFYP